MASIFSTFKNAYSFAYGINPNVQALRVQTGNSVTGSASTVILFNASITTSDGLFVPNTLSTYTPITIGNGSNVETITPTSVTQNADGTVTVGGTFSNTHGQGDNVQSGTYGLAEAVKYAHGTGGLVVVDGEWSQKGGITSTITGTLGYTNVTIYDGRGTSGATSYKAASNGSDYAATTVTLY